MPDLRNKWPKQREPSPIAGQIYPNQQPIVGVFGQEGFGEQFLVNAPAITAQQQQISEETQIQELPDLHNRPIEEDVEILAAEMLLKADRSATDWKPITYTFDGVNPQQVGRMVGRVTIVLFNGTGNVMVARTVNGLSVASNENFTLVQGASVSVDTEGEFYLTAAVGIKLSVIQTFWDLGAMVVAKERTKRHYNRRPINWTGVKASANTK
jgi:hypothetical protein